METNNNTFHAGICMAGAVSAGAYTAGVIDYLLETLEHWEEAKELQKAGKLTNIPTHNFLLDILSGASAGGMTAAITVAALQSDFPHVIQQDDANEEKKKQNPLFNAWVNLTEESGKDMMDFMLCNDDIENDKENEYKEVRAGFNSSFIPQVASSIIDTAVKNEKFNRPYIAPDLDIFTTITNLRGYKYSVKFRTSQGDRKHKMSMHRDYAFFQLNEDDTYKKNGRIPIHFNTKEGYNKKILKDAAMATGAFPVGLESRELTRDHDFISDNKYLNLTLGGLDKNTVEYTFLPEGPFLSLNVDGGVINNEPFDLTQQLLEDRRKDELISKFKQNLLQDTDSKLEPGSTIPQANKTQTAEDFKTDLDQNFKLAKDATNFDSLVLMVDPFPSDDEELPTTFNVRKAWKNVLPAILSAMRGQLMMKDEQVQKAYLSDDYTRFLISPVRTLNNTQQKFAIACGSFGGFGGFFSKAFRNHDFYLGRRNCQRFLQRYLSVPENAKNSILESGYNGYKNEYIFDDHDISYLPIIPDIRVVQDKVTGVYSTIKPEEEKEYLFPSISLTYLLGLQDKIEKRFNCIMNNISNVVANTEPVVEDQGLKDLFGRIRKKSFFGKLFAKVVTSNLINLYVSAGKKFGKGPAADMFLDAVITDMYKRGLLRDDYKK